MKTIESLVNASKKVYVHMSSDEICRRFFAQAEREGFLFGGEKPTKKEPSDIIAVLPDKTICYVGTMRPVCGFCGTAGKNDEEILLKFGRFSRSFVSSQNLHRINQRIRRSKKCKHLF